MKSSTESRKNIFCKVPNKIYNSWLCGQKNVLSEASPFQEMCQKSEIHKNQNSPSCSCTLNACVMYAKASQSSVPSLQSNGEENVILFDYITGVFFLD